MFRISKGASIFLDFLISKNNFWESFTSGILIVSNNLKVLLRRRSYHRGNGESGGTPRNRRNASLSPPLTDAAMVAAKGPLKSHVRPCPFAGVTSSSLWPTELSPDSIA